jgi:hypothetical protein
MLLGPDHTFATLPRPAAVPGWGWIPEYGTESYEDVDKQPLAVTRACVTRLCRNSPRTPSGVR